MDFLPAGKKYYSYQSILYVFRRSLSQTSNMVSSNVTTMNLSDHHQAPYKAPEGVKLSPVSCVGTRDIRAPPVGMLLSDQVVPIRQGELNLPPVHTPLPKHRSIKKVDTAYLMSFHSRISDLVRY
jgi:hypothetical protein